MKANNIYYKIENIVLLSGLSRFTVLKRIRDLELQPCFKRKGNSHQKCFLYSIEKLNQITSIGVKCENFNFIVSDFNNATQTFVEYQSKINNNGYN